MAPQNNLAEKIADSKPINKMSERKEHKDKYYCAFCNEYRDIKDMALIYPAKPHEGLCFQHSDDTVD